MGAATKISKYIKQLINIIAIIFIKFYQFTISPILHCLSLSTVGGGCRFYPSCSEYSKQAIELYGFGFKSVRLICNRLFSCRPFIFKKILNKNNNKSFSYDPVVSIEKSDVK